MGEPGPCSGGEWRRSFFEMSDSNDEGGFSGCSRRDGLPGERHLRGGWPGDLPPSVSYRGELHFRDHSHNQRLPPGSTRRHSLCGGGVLPHGTFRGKPELSNAQAGRCPSRAVRIFTTASSMPMCSCGLSGITAHLADAGHAAISAALTSPSFYLQHKRGEDDPSWCSGITFQRPCNNVTSAGSGPAGRLAVSRLERSDPEHLKAIVPSSNPRWTRFIRPRSAPRDVQDRTLPA